LSLHRHPGNRRRSALLLRLLTGAWFALAAMAGEAAAPPSEYAVKAALLPKLARFVTWPADGGPRGEFAVCVLGPDPFEAALDELRSQQIKGRAVTVMRLQSAERAASECDVVFVSDVGEAGVGHALAILRGRPVLTVGDVPGFASRGGVVELVTQDRRIVFTINVAAAQAARLEIGSQLLQLATLVSARERNH